jgi:hypothetical protein
MIEMTNKSFAILCEMKYMMLKITGSKCIQKIEIIRCACTTRKENKVSSPDGLLRGSTTLSQVTHCP